LPVGRPPRCDGRHSLDPRCPVKVIGAVIGVVILPIIVGLIKK
jgi:hypothetical protein